MLRYFHQAALFLTIIPRQERVQEQVLPQLLNQVAPEAALAVAQVEQTGAVAIHLCGILGGLRWAGDTFAVMGFIM